MYHRLVTRIVHRRYGELDRHDPSTILRRFAADVHFRFGGEHALAIDCHTRAEAQRWFEHLYARFPDLRFEVQEVIVSGTPWNTRICTRYRTRATGAAGQAVINHAVQIARLRWGRITEELLYPDTQAIAAGLSGAR